MSPVSASYLLAGLLAVLAAHLTGQVEGRSLPAEQPVLASPSEELMGELDLERNQMGASQRHSQVRGELGEASSLTPVPVYVSPFVRPVGSRGGSPAAAAAAESSGPAANWLAAPVAPVAPVAPGRDLKAAASYYPATATAGDEQHEAAESYSHGSHHDDTSGWLDMGAWTGAKGAFGWYSDFPVGGHKHY